MKKSWIYSVLLSLIFAFGIVLVPFEAEAKSKEEKKRELQEKLKKLQNERERLNQEAQEKMKDVSSSQDSRQSLSQTIRKYEEINKGCEGKRSHKCKDVIYTLGKLYYQKGKDDYSAAQEEYNRKMEEWSKTGQGSEPVSPVPDYSKALETFREAVSRFPKFKSAPEAYYQMGNIYRLQGEIEKSKDAFKQIVVKFPDHVRASAAHFNLAEYAFMERDFSSSLKHIEEIDMDLVSYEIREMAHYRKGEIYYNRAAFDKAVELFYDYIEQCDNGNYKKEDLRGEALEYLAISFSDMPYGAKKAIKFFEKEGHKSYEDTVLYTIGMKNYDHGQYQDAILALSEAIENYPYHVDAPNAQQMIVASYIIRKKHDKALEARKKLIDKYNRNSEWATRHEGKSKVLARARDKVKEALAALPLVYHSDAQKTKSKAKYEKALERYNQFIEMFPDAKWKVYEFHYNAAEIYSSLRQYKKAAEYYDYVASADLSTYPEYKKQVDTLGYSEEEVEEMKQKKAESDSPISVSQEDAGYNAIAAMDKLRKKIKGEKGLDDKEAYSLPETQDFLEYGKKFVSRFPESSSSAEVLYLLGNVHYNAEKFTEAIGVYKKIIADYSGSKHADKATRMIANAYVKQGKYDLAISKYNNLLDKEKPDTKEHKEVLDLAASALFKKAEEQKEEGNHVQAAEMFKEVYKKFEGSDVADNAWFEAAVTYEDAGKLDLAAETFKELPDNFEDSDLREKSFVRAAKAYEKNDETVKAAQVYAEAAKTISDPEFAIPSFSKAAEKYKEMDKYELSAKMHEEILTRYPTHESTPQAVYNSAMMYEKGEMYEEAIRLYRVLADKYGDSEYAAEGFYSIGFCYEAMGENEKMAQAFTNYAERFSDNKSKQVEALVRAAEAYAKLGDLDKAEKNCLTAIDIHDKFERKAAIDPESISKAYYRLGKIRHERFDQIELTGRNEQVVQNKLEKKTEVLQPVLEAYTNCIKIGIAEWTLQATYAIGKSFTDFANAFEAQSLFGNETEKMAGKIKVLSGLEKYYDKAQEKFAWILDKAWDQGIESKYVDRAEDELMRMAYEKGHLLEKVGELFKESPIPPEFSKEEKQAYKDALEEKYLKSLDAALPKYEEGMEAAKHYGLTDNEWVDSIRDRIEYINPASEALTMTIEEREPKQVVTEDGEKEEVKPKTKAERQLERAMEQIAKVMELRVPVDQKIQQLKQIELTAKRKISEEKEKIKEYKNELEIE